MGNILTATVTICGKRPLWWHKFGPEYLPLEKKEQEGVAGNSPNEWRSTFTATKEGQLYIDASYIFGCMKAAARYTKKGRGSIQSAVAATLQCTDDPVLIDRYMPGFPNGHECNPQTVDTPSEDRTQPVYLDVRGVVNPNTKGHNVRYRVAASAGWMTTFHLQWDKTIVDRYQMQAVVTDAGPLVGIGNGRSIGMGRFELVSFVVDEA